MEIGDLVTWKGRTYRLVGFDPMSVDEPRAHLEDVETRSRVLAPLREVEEARPRPATG